MSPKSARHRYVALDGLRGLAALFVVFYHAPWATHFSDTQFVKNAYLSVDFFFVLSGFVIAANYAGAIVDGASLRDFLQRRFFRLYPLHFLVLMTLVALEAIKYLARGAIASEVPPFTGPNSPSLLVESLLMAQGLGLENRLGWNPPSWSISAEFATYILYALAATSGLLRRDRTMLAIAAVALIVYFVVALTQGTLDVTYFLGFVRSVAGFSLGVAVQRFSPSADRLADTRGAARLSSLAPLVALAALATLALAKGASVFIAIPLFVALVATLQFDRGRVARLLSTGPMQFLGRISYSVYLVHMPILYVATILLKRLPGVGAHAGPHGVALDVASPWLGDLLFAGAIAMLLFVARFTYAAVEEPGRRLGSRMRAPRGLRVAARV